MAQRATSLGPKPSLFVICFLLFLFFVFCFFFGGFKGQVRWPEGPPHLALNPPYLFIYLFIYLFLFLFLFFCSFPFFAFEWQKTLFFPPKKGHFCLFSVFLFLSASTFFGLPLVQFLFFCLSLSLSLSLLFCSFFLPFLSFFFLLSFGSFFFSLSHFSFFFAFLFWKEQHEMFKLQFIFSSIFSLFYGFLSCFSLSNPFFLSLFFLVFSYVCCWTSMYLVSKNTSWKTPILVKRGVATKRGFSIKLCFEKCEKLSFFAPFLANFWLMFKNTIQIGISAHFQKQKEEKKWPFSKVVIRAKLMLLSGPSFLQHKNGQLGPDNNFGNFCAHFFFSKKSAEIPIFRVFFANSVKKKTNLAQIITLKPPNLAQIITSQRIYIYIYVYIYIYICAWESLFWNPISIFCCQ